MHGDLDPTREPGRRSAAPLAQSALLLALLLIGAVVRAQAPPATYDPQSAFRQSDANQDGAVDHGEFETRMTDVFYFADTNKDGSLSAQECTVTLVETESPTASDSNHDGKMTLHEFTRARLYDYEQADTNDDGLLQLDEVTGAFQTPKK